MKRERKRLDKWHPVRAHWRIAGGFAIATLVGALLLSLPLASKAGHWIDYSTALFTATSACCVTGLTIVDTGTTFSPFGQAVIIALVQLGGLGIMTFSTFLLVLVGRRLSIRDEFIISSSLGNIGVKGLSSLLRYALAMTLLLEIAGAAILTWRYITNGYTTGKAIYYGLFHAISAFCNAGFSLHQNSLAPFAHDYIYLLTVSLLTLCGGLGFLVLYNLSTFRFWKRNRRTRGRISLHTRIVIKMSLLLIFSAAAIFYCTEYHNAFHGMSPFKRIASSLFHAITVRTTGFTTIPFENFSAIGRSLSLNLALIGGAPGSTAGGIKVTTVAVLILTIRAMMRGHIETEIGGRTISRIVVRQAMVVFILTIFTITLLFNFLLLIETPPLAANNTELLLTEVVSAFSTVGFSLQVSPILSVAGRITIVIAMLIGRLGPLAATLFIGTRDVGQHIYYPEEEVIVG